jgi:predicted AlkP superfamily pyrophosphatase or phosphodiesterase
MGAAALLLAGATAANAASVLMISVDGLRPGDVLEADKRGIRIPTLQGLVETGTYASGVRNVLPTVTYPDHTTLITGVWPARHGIANNLTFDPKQENYAGWYWYTRDIKVKTLWDAVHDAHGTVASLSWPVSVGATSIDYDVPEYWRAHNADDIKLLRALTTPGLADQMEKATGIALADADGELVENDINRTRYAAALIAARHPRFTTVHLRGLDHVEHGSGPGSPEANHALEQLDGAIGTLIIAARKAEPDLVVAIVSDHGFAAVSHDVNLVPAFVQAGLLTVDPKTQKVTAWKAEPWGSASAAIMLADPKDAALKAKVSDLLAKLAADPQYGIVRVADAAEIARMGGTPMASFWIDFKPGYEMSANPAAPEVGPGAQKGTHGYFPTHPEMRATFILQGPGFTKKGPLGEIDMRDIAPTLAKIMNVSLPGADGHPLW